MKKIICSLCIIFTFSIVSNCKKKNYTKPNSSIMINALSSKSTKPISIRIGSQKKETFQISFKNSYLTGSPLATLTIPQLDSLKLKNAYVMDLSLKGSIRPISDTSVSSPSCFQIGIYNILKNTGSTYSVLISELNNNSTFATDDFNKLGDFQYCESQTTIDIQIPDQQTAENFASYLLQRRAVLSKQSLNLVLTTSLVGNMSDAIEIATVKFKTKIPHFEERLTPHETIKPITPHETIKSTTPHETIKPTSHEHPTPDMNSILRNERDVQRFRDLEIKSLIPKVGQPFPSGVTVLGEGAYAKVYKVKVKDGKEYAMRIEQKKPNETMASFRKSKEQERLNYLTQNIFAEAHPEAGFLRTELSLVTEDGQFITLSELKGGGDLRADLERRGDPTPELEAHRMNINQQVQEQVRHYQSGVPIHINGKKHTMYFFHGDIKPENIMLDASGKQATLVDFGFSRILLKDSEGHYKELKVDNEGNAKEVDLKVTAFGDSGILKGSPMYVSREAIFAMRNYESYSKSGEEALHTLFSIENQALNGTQYEFFYGFHHIQLLESEQRIALNDEEKVFSIAENYNMVTDFFKSRQNTHPYSSRSTFKYESYEDDLNVIKESLLKTKSNQITF